MGSGWKILRGGAKGELAILDSIAKTFTKEGEENVLEVIQGAPSGDHSGIK